VKQTQEALRGSQERLQLALQATGLGPWEWDLATNAVEFWPEWKRQIGYEPDEIANRYEEWESRLHPTTRNGC
jgi:PAS domain-containing protein